MQGSYLSSISNLVIFEFFELQLKLLHDSLSLGHFVVELFSVNFIVIICTQFSRLKKIMDF